MSVSAVSSITSTATQGLNAAENTVVAAAQTIASGGANPASSQIDPTAGAGLTGALVALNMATISFKANADTLKVGNEMLQTLLNVV
jgi:hypothetical protein